MNLTSEFSFSIFVQSNPTQDNISQTNSSFDSINPHNTPNPSHPYIFA